MQPMAIRRNDPTGFGFDVGQTKTTAHFLFGKRCESAEFYCVKFHVRLCHFSVHILLLPDCYEESFDQILVVLVDLLVSLIRLTIVALVAQLDALDPAQVVEELLQEFFFV
jgi:hypothetical protein